MGGRRGTVGAIAWFTSSNNGWVAGRVCGRVSGHVHSVVPRRRFGLVVTTRKPAHSSVCRVCGHTSTVGAASAVRDQVASAPCPQAGHTV